MNEQQQPSLPSKSASTTRLALWLTFVAFLLIIVVFRSKISEIHFDEHGVSAKMASTEELDKLSPEDRTAAEQALAQRVETLEQQGRGNAQSQAQNQTQNQAQDQVQSQPPAEQPVSTAPASQADPQQPAQPQQAAIPNIAGNWVSSLGLVYQVLQYGNYVVIKEVNQGIVDAVAAGPIYGWTFNLATQNIQNNTGMVTVSVAADQRHMTGQYFDNHTGQSYTITLSR
jgi:hypothetical protein